MTSAWGGSWGASWGNSWGVINQEQPSGGIWKGQVAEVRRIAREQAEENLKRQRLENVVADAVSEQIERIEATEDARRLAALVAGTGAEYIPIGLDVLPVVSIPLPVAASGGGMVEEIHTTQSEISTSEYLEKQRKRNAAALTMIIALTETLH